MNKLPRGFEFVPLGLNRTQAAYYVGVGVTKFDSLVSQGRIPPPRKIDRRLVWVRHELDAAVTDFPQQETHSSFNPWDQLE